MSLRSRTTGTSYTGLFVNPIQQWSQFFERCNWYDFTLIKIEFEDDRIMGGVEGTVVLLGLGLRVRWNYAKTEQVHEIERRKDEAMRSLGLTDADDNSNN